MRARLMEIKPCPSCGVTRTPENSWRRANGAFQGYCKPCHKKKMGLNRMLAKAQGRDWYSKNKEKSKRLSTISAYRITYDAVLAMFEACAGRCRLCGNEMYLHRRGRHKAVVDHCHKSGKVRGVICMSCNCALGSFFDNPDTARKAADYLEKHKAA